MQTFTITTTYWSEADLKGVIDLVKMKGVVWQNEDLEQNLNM